MNGAVARQMIAADLLKLRRHRSTMGAALLLSVGVTALYLAVILARHGGTLPGSQTLADGTSLMGQYFGSFAAILIGAEAGTADTSSGVFRDLAATGRSRTALFLTRIPAAVAVALAFTLSGFLVSTVAAYAFRGGAPAPGAALVAESAGWVALATAVITSLSVGLGSLTGSRALTITTIIGWNTVATGVLWAASFLGSTRDLVLLIALGDLLPGPSVGTRAHPGSSNALINFKLDMPAVVAVAVIAGWVVLAAAAGAWRTRARDA